MKTYKVCLTCINTLKEVRWREEGARLNAGRKERCQQKPRCFDQPERNKEINKTNSLSKEALQYFNDKLNANSVPRIINDNWIRPGYSSDE